QVGWPPSTPTIAAVRSISVGVSGVPRLSFPTRRSSDLAALADQLGGPVRLACAGEIPQIFADCEWGGLVPFGTLYGLPTLLDARSEEHTSELQSRSDLVCRLLLEKKNEPVHPVYRQRRR